MKKGKLAAGAAVKFLIGIVLVGLLLFWPAGTFKYPGGWRFMGLLFIPMLGFGAVLLLKAPGLLKKRLNTHEREKDQKGVVAAAGLLFIASFTLSGLDFRFGWTAVPMGLIIAASILMLLSYGMYMEVMRENAYLSRTVEVQEGQKVIDSGLYGVVRHPMYAAVIILFLSMPLVLGSWIAFGVMCVYPVIIILRIKGEERVLEAGLSGYAEYKMRVKYRLIPFVW